MKISVVIITYNEESNLARCLESVRNIADEVLVADSFSTDNTVAIATRFGARVVTHAFEGYGQQKNYAVSQAANDWILSLDADEEVSTELEKSILDLGNNPQFNVYEMPRVTNYCGKWIWHCGWYPDRQTRLFNRSKGRWAEPMVHEYWRLNDEGPKGCLEGNLLHYSFRSVDEHLKKIQKYSELGARQNVSKGKNVSLLKMILFPGWKFVTDYVFRLGFLDGRYGFIICKLSAWAAFLKYKKTRLYSQEQRLAANAK